MLNASDYSRHGQVALAFRRYIADATPTITPAASEFSNAGQELPVENCSSGLFADPAWCVAGEK
jgi:hypothetical protein